MSIPRAVFCCEWWELTLWISGRQNKDDMFWRLFQGFEEALEAAVVSM